MQQMLKLEKPILWMWLVIFGLLGCAELRGNDMEQLLRQLEGIQSVDQRALIKRAGPNNPREVQQQARLEIVWLRENPSKVQTDPLLEIVQKMPTREASLLAAQAIYASGDSMAIAKLRETIRKTDFSIMRSLATIERWHMSDSIRGKYIEQTHLDQQRNGLRMTLACHEQTPPNEENWRANLTIQIENHSDKPLQILDPKMYAPSMFVMVQKDDSNIYRAARDRIKASPGVPTYSVLEPKEKLTRTVELQFDSDKQRLVAGFSYFQLPFKCRPKDVCYGAVFEMPESFSKPLTSNSDPMQPKFWAGRLVAGPSRTVTGEDRHYPEPTRDEVELTKLLAKGSPKEKYQALNKFRAEKQPALVSAVIELVLDDSSLPREGDTGWGSIHHLAANSLQLYAQSLDGLELKEREAFFFDLLRK